MIIEKLVVGPLQENCYIVADETTRQGVVIDPGDEAARIVEAVRRLGVTVGTIVNTHAHVDHIAAAQAVKEQLEAKLYLHPEESMHLPELVEHAAMFGIFGARRATVDVPLADGDRIPFGSCHLTVSHTPGHTPGHCILICGQDIFCGDLIFAGSIGRTDLPGGDYGAMVASLESVVMALPDEARLHPGHGESTTVAIEKRFNPFLRGLKSRQRKLAEPI